MTDKNRQIKSILKAEGVAMFDNLNETASRIDGCTYSFGDWLKDALKDLQKENVYSIPWREIASKDYGVFSTDAQLQKVIDDREERGSNRDSFTLGEEYIGYLENEVIPAITECYPGMEQYVRTNFAIWLVMRWFVTQTSEGRKYFTSPESQETTDDE